MIYTSDLLSFSDMKKIIQKTGMGVETIAFSISDNLDHFDNTITEYRNRMETMGVTDLIIHGPFLDLNPMAFDSKIQQTTKYRFAQAYDAGLQLGAKKIIYHTGFIPSVHFLQGWADRVTDFFQSFMENRTEMEVLIENVLDPYPEPVKRVKAQVNAANFKLCLDIGHVNCYSKVPVAQWITCYGEDIGHVHLHNNDGKEDSHSALSDGTISAGDVIAMCRKAAPEATYTIECNTLEDVLESYGFL